MFTVGHVRLVPYMVPMSTVQVISLVHSLFLLFLCTLYFHTVPLFHIHSFILFHLISSHSTILGPVTLVSGVFQFLYRELLDTYIILRIISLSLISFLSTHTNFFSFFLSFLLFCPSFSFSHTSYPSHHVRATQITTQRS